MDSENKQRVVITGADSQLAQCLKDQIKVYNTIETSFVSKNDLDITDKKQVDSYFKQNTFEYCINCAAYTAVDKAEEEEEKLAFAINAEGVKNLAEACRKEDVVLIHISTDFVFDGHKQTPYVETDTVNPLNVYGTSKRQGELDVVSSWEKHFIIRTSWLYSEYGSNFVKTMLRLAQAKDQLSIVEDQIGSPTYARDLADVILQLIEKQNTAFGIYHYANDGAVSWFDFAKEIFKQANVKIDLKPTTAKAFNSAAKRPRYSVLSSYKIDSLLDLKPKKWQISLKKVIPKIGA